MKLGDRALLLPRPTGVAASALLERLRAWPNVIDAVIAETHVAAYFSTAPTVDEAMMAKLAAPAPHVEIAPRVHELHVVYDGEDLDHVAAQARTSPSEVIRLHTEATYEVAMMGFSPGFAYLTGLHPDLIVARRPTPRAHVEAGAVAIAGPYTGVYPRASPGGWNLLGRVVNARMFDAETGPLLALGDRVRFVRAEAR